MNLLQLFLFWPYDFKDLSGRNYIAILRGTSPLKNNGYNNCKIEGSESEDWKLIDAIDVIVHLFHPEKRYIYNLEKMWEDILPKEQVRI